MKRELPERGADWPALKSRMLDFSRDDVRYAQTAAAIIRLWPSAGK